MVWFGDDLAAVAGGLLVLGVVFMLGQRRGLVDPVAIILVGVVVSMICGALMMLVQHLSPAGMRADLITWMMGEIPQLVDRSTLLAAGVITGLAAIIAVGAGRAMDVAVLDDDEARTVGLSLGRLRLFLFLASGLLTAGAVAVAGPIGFVGLVGPHVARLLVGSRHRLLVVGSVITGIALVVGADAARQTIDLGRGRLPIGVLTALVGGPMFIWLLRRSGRSG
jgi:iron complex transport system permease protein